MRYNECNRKKCSLFYGSMARRTAVPLSENFRRISPENDAFWRIFIVGFRLGAVNRCGTQPLPLRRLVLTPAFSISPLSRCGFLHPRRLLFAVDFSRVDCNKRSVVCGHGRGNDFSVGCAKFPFLFPFLSPLLPFPPTLFHSLPSLLSLVPSSPF